MSVTGGFFLEGMGGIDIYIFIFIYNKEGGTERERERDPLPIHHCSSPVRCRFLFLWMLQSLDKLFQGIP